MPDLTEQEYKDIVFDRLMFQSQWRNIDGTNIRIAFLSCGPDKDDLLMFQVDELAPIAMPVMDLYRLLQKA